MLNIVCHWGTANQNNNAVPLQPIRMADIQNSDTTAVV